MSKLNTEDKQNLTDNFCNELLRKGIKPTVSLVLEKLPNSSRSTGHKYLKNWTDAQNKNKEEVFKKLGFSSEFTSSLLNEINRFNCHAEGRYKEQALDAIDQRDHALSDLQNSENKVNEQSNLIQQQEEKIKNIHTELAKEQKSNESIVNEIRRQLTTSIDDNKQLGIQNESLRTGIAKAELKLEGNQEFVKEVKSQSSQLTIDNKELNSNIAELNRSVASKESTILGNNKLILTLEKEQVKTATQLSNFDSNNTNLQSEITSLRNDLSIISNKLTEEKDKFTQQVSVNNEVKSNFEEQTRSHEKTLRSYETTITGNEKLIAQLEKTQKNQS
ncbi:MAG: chromosome segregation ATPase [Colwellia sp.]|jgi:chromosome segregation ATPase